MFCSLITIFWLLLESMRDFELYHFIIWRQVMSKSQAFTFSEQLNLCRRCNLSYTFLLCPIRQDRWLACWSGAGHMVVLSYFFILQFHRHALLSSMPALFFVPCNLLIKPYCLVDLCFCPFFLTTGKIINWEKFFRESERLKFVLPRKFWERNTIIS